MRNLLPSFLAELGWSDAELAKKVGIDRSRINRIKNGRVEPRLSEGLAIADALGCEVEELFKLVELVEFAGDARFSRRDARTFRRNYGQGARGPAPRHRSTRGLCP